MSAYILSVGTAVPLARLEQHEARDFFIAQPGIDRLASRLIRSAFDQSAISSRYTIVGAAGEWLPEFVDTEGRLRSPSTGERNAIYRREAPSLFASAASDALARSGRQASEITHIMTASCTGFFAPGPDFLLINDLGIPRTAERTHIGFMGCAAAFPALRAAARVCDANPAAVVLVVCGEICSIHLRSSRDPEQIVASAVFGDGAAAAIMCSDAEQAPGSVLEVGDFRTTITSEGEGDMDWTVGDHGFEMRLTPEVPRIIGREIRGAVDDLLGAGSRASPDTWAVHPGGRSVLDRAQSSLGLPHAAMQHSRDVLREYGNMSSATILFILQRIMLDESLGNAGVAGLCFGPGLTVEAARFRRRPRRPSGALGGARKTALL